MKMFLPALLVLVTIFPCYGFAKLEISPSAILSQGNDTAAAIVAKDPAPTSGTDANVPANEKGPTFLIEKISFKNIHPDVQGFSIECHGLESKDSGVPVLVGYTAYNKYFVENPARRTSSELTNLSITSKLSDTYKATKKSIATAILWRCHTTAVLKNGGYSPFSVSEQNCDTCMKANSVPIIKGSF